MKEHLNNNPESEASRFINNFQNVLNWEFIAPLMNEEVQNLKASRLRKRDGKTITNERIYTTALLAAEFFPDEKPPRLVIAESEDELHEDLRERFPSEGRRISGEIIRATNKENFQFFSMDPIVIKIKSMYLPTKADLKEVSEYLLSQNIAPLDAEMRIIKNDTETSQSQARIMNIFNL